MSMSKRILFGKEPLPESMRAERQRNLERLQSQFTVRIPTRRKNPFYGRRWDPMWPGCLARAARDLGIESVHVNDGLFVASDSDAERIKEQAQKEWDEHARRLRKASEPIEF